MLGTELNSHVYGSRLPKDMKTQTKVNGGEWQILACVSRECFYFDDKVVRERKGREEIGEELPLIALRFFTASRDV